MCFHLFAQYKKNYCGFDDPYFENALLTKILWSSFHVFLTILEICWDYRKSFSDIIILVNLCRVFCCWIDLWSLVIFCTSSVNLLLWYKFNWHISIFDFLKKNLSWRYTLVNNYTLVNLNINLAKQQNKNL